MKERMWEKCGLEENEISILFGQEFGDEGRNALRITIREGDRCAHVNFLEGNNGQWLKIEENRISLSASYFEDLLAALKIKIMEISDDGKL